MFCQIGRMIHHPAMKTVIWLPSLCLLILFVGGCTNNQTAGNDPLGTGPFDSRGNYVEEWANDPSKWRKPGGSTRPPSGDEVPTIARNEQPPPNSNPLAPKTAPATKPAPTPVVSMPKETSRPTATPKSTPTKPKTTVVKAKPKPKPKPKPKTTRYVVKKGDSLSAIASRNGSSVSAIQRANGISGTLIRPGQSLVIPKR